MKVPPLSFITAPFCPNSPTPVPCSSIVDPGSKFTVEFFVTIAPTPFSPFNNILAPLPIVTLEGFAPPLFPIYIAVPAFVPFPMIICPV